MTPIMKRTEKDDAVSPVVGVMLMLVVTIIIAAVVAAFASGVVSNTEAAPNVMLKATVDSAWNAGEFTTGVGALFLTSLSGDNVNLEKITVKISDVTQGSAEKIYTAPTKAWTVGKYLNSGATLNVIYGMGSDPDTGKYESLNTALGKTVAKGDIMSVTVIYDGTHVLYDKEVIAE